MSITSKTTDLDNQDWTSADFARARGPDSLSDLELAAFPKSLSKSRGRPKLDEPKQVVSFRLSAELVRRLKASGKGWQTRAAAILEKSLSEAG